jgi:DNA-binding XRE family transcriptional regulator
VPRNGAPDVSPRLVTSGAKNPANRLDFYIVVGEALRRERERQELTQPELAKRAGITRHALSQAECGSNCSLMSLALLAHELDVTLDDLVPIDALSTVLG